MQKTKIIVSALVVCTGIGFTLSSTGSNVLVDEWNRFDTPSRVVTEIDRDVKKLNSANRPDEIQKLLSDVYNGLDLASYNAMSKERLCTLYDSYNMSLELRSCYRDIINSEKDEDDIKAWIRIAKKQLKYNQDRSDGETLYNRVHDRVANTLSTIDASSNTDVLIALVSVSDDRLDEYDRYQVAKTLLQYDYQTDKAQTMLWDLIGSTTRLALASRSYFVLGRYALDQHDYQTAYKIYSQYVVQFAGEAEMAYFVSKAHQRLLQLSVELGLVTEVESNKQKLMQHASSIRDLRSSFDAARKLADQGMMEEALTMFDRGVASVATRSQVFTFYERLRLYTEIIRTGNDIGVDFELQNGYIKLADEMTKYGLHDEIKVSKEARYLYSQFLLWSAEAYYLHDRPETAEGYYGRYIASFPDSKDYEYAVYRFLALCGKRQCNQDGDELIFVMLPNDNGLWSKTAIGTLTSLTADVRNTAWKGEISKWLN